MKVRDLIGCLNAVEDKEQNVFVANYDFDQNSEIQSMVEIKSTSDKITYPVGVCLIIEL